MYVIHQPINPMNTRLIDDMATPKYSPRVYTADALPQYSGGKLSEIKLKLNGKVAAKQISINILGNKIARKLLANACTKLATLHRKEKNINPHFRGTRSAMKPMKIADTAVIIVYVVPDNTPYYVSDKPRSILRLVFGSSPLFEYTIK